jgi:hypothetical protein
VNPLTEAEREELSNIFGYVPEPEPLEALLAAVDRMIEERADRIADGLFEASEVGG